MNTNLQASLVESAPHCRKPNEIIMVRDFVIEALGVRAVISLLLDGEREEIRDEVCLWKATDRWRFVGQCTQLAVAYWLDEEEIEEKLRYLENEILKHDRGTKKESRK